MPAICPPYQIPLDIVLGSGVMRYFPPMEALDAEGRPLLEGRSLRWTLPRESYRTCRYPGQRHNHRRPMNVGALRQFMARRTDVLAYFRTLSQEVAARLGPDDPLQLTLRVSHAAYHAPKRWLLAGPSPQAPDGVAATAAKLGHGVYEGCLGTIMRGEIAPADASPEIIADEAEASGQLIGRKEVCAGPRHLMIEVIGAMQSGLNAPARLRGAGHEATVTLAKHLWQAESLAQGNAYAALARRARRDDLCGIDALLPQARITFPNALDIVQAVAVNRAPGDGFLRAYVQKQDCDADIPLSCRAALDMARRVLSLAPDSPALDAAGALLRRMSVAAFTGIDAALGEAALVPPDAAGLSPDLLDAVFGELDMSQRVAPLALQEIAP